MVTSLPFAERLVEVIRPSRSILMTPALTPASNMKLSTDRAESVKKVLNGIISVIVFE